MMLNSSPCFRLPLATRLRLGVPTLWHADGSRLGDLPLGVFFVRHRVPTGLPSRSIFKYARAQVYPFKTNIRHQYLDTTGAIAPQLNR
jgi:hypothetical protein